MHALRLLERAQRESAKIRKNNLKRVLYDTDEKEEEAPAIATEKQHQPTSRVYVAKFFYCCRKIFLIKYKYMYITRNKNIIKIQKTWSCMKK